MVSLLLAGWLAGWLASWLAGWLALGCDFARWLARGSHAVDSLAARMMAGSWLALLAGSLAARVLADGSGLAAGPWLVLEVIALEPVELVMATAWPCMPC